MSEVETLAPQLRADVERAGALKEEARELLGGLSPKQLAWSPGPGKWSVAETVAHMRITNELYLVAFEETLRRARENGARSDGPFRYGWFETWFARQLEPPPKRAFKAPGRFRPSTGEIPPDTVERFLDGLTRLERTMISAGGLDLARIKITSPITKLLRFRLGAAFRIVLAHTARHLLQVKNTRDTEGFPGGDS